MNRSTFSALLSISAFTLGGATATKSAFLIRQIMQGVNMKTANMNIAIAALLPLQSFVGYPVEKHFEDEDHCNELRC